jgi:formylglycine-generating enzyme required for sulfatase activity
MRELLRPDGNRNTIPIVLLRPKGGIMGFVIAILFCLGDNCDLVQPEPDVTYQTYEACSQATAKKAEELSKIAAAKGQQGRQGEIICLRQLLAITELDEEREALTAIDIRDAPEGTARQIGTVPRGSKLHITGAVAGSAWLRVALPDGRSGYVIAERTRKLALDELNRTSTVASAALPRPPPASPPAEPAPPASGSALPQQRAATQPPRLPAKETASAPGEFRDCDTCPAMVPLPSGSFEMGSRSDPTELPIHSVTLSAFAIGKFVVTQEEWKACAAARGCSYQTDAANGRLPMMNLSWDDAVQYVQYLKQSTGKPYRLPSEAEWEYAARAKTNSPYPWGAQPGAAMANCNGCGGSYDAQLPASVGSFPPNKWGLYDMAGGVAEWVEDCWHRNYDGAPANGAAWLSPRCTAHVLRGGSWKNPPKDVMVSTRNYYDTSVRYIANGVRVALSLTAGR